MRIASIDIGTNAIKSKIFETTPTSIDFLEAIRSPIRLGDDVFRHGKLSQGKLDEVIDTIKEYEKIFKSHAINQYEICLLYTSPSPRDRTRSRMPSSA